jgi:hypothetical protein
MAEVRYEMRVADLFTKHSKPADPASKVLVCGIGPQLQELTESDSAVYSRYYTNLDTALFSDVNDLMDAARRGYDVIHLLVQLSPGGLLSRLGDSPVFGSDLIQVCCEQGVKLLWIAYQNNSDDYVSGFKAAGKSLNLIMTISRSGTKFQVFLDNLLSRVSKGETLPNAWVALVPQATGHWQQELPVCIFYAGKGEAKLLS